MPSTSGPSPTDTVFDERVSTRLSIATLVTAAFLLIAGSTVAHADVIAVDPGRDVSAGKRIVGTGQNLPTLDATSTWNIGAGPAELVNTYYSSDRARQDQAAVAQAARAWSEAWIRKTCGATDKAKVRACKVAAVFDIDDTLLSTYPTLSANTPAFTFSSSAFDAAATSCTAPVIEPVKALYVHLKRLGVNMVLLTGRGEELREPTKKCLQKAGITGWAKFVLRQADDKDSASTYKAKARKALIDQGWKIGPSVGDQVSDMSYGALGRGFLLPNPMYLIP